MKGQQVKLKTLSTLMALGFALAVGCKSPGPSGTTNAVPAATSQAEGSSDEAVTPGSMVTLNSNKDFSVFSHSEPQHARLPCLLCHRRETSSIKPVRSHGHTPCAGCHTEQFAASSGTICTICHTDPQSENSRIKPFPALKSFNLKFDHAKHKRTRCEACHKPARLGLALSIPSGFDAHATCYRCHSPEAQVEGQGISSCGTCHEEGRYRQTPAFAKSFQKGFSHAAHVSRGNLSCKDCHTSRAGLPIGRQVTSPAPVQHLEASRGMNCRSCHDGKRAFGEDDSSDCKKCHKGEDFKF